MVKGERTAQLYTCDRFVADLLTPYGRQYESDVLRNCCRGVAGFFDHGSCTAELAPWLDQRHCESDAGWNCLRLVVGVRSRGKSRHLDRDVNERGVVLDKQAHLAPVVGLGSPRAGELFELVAESINVAPKEILGADLMLHDLTAPALLGFDQELVASARLDNLCSTHAAVMAIIGAGRQRHATSIIALFDHEEVGSESTAGAAGTLLETTLARLVHAQGGGGDELARMLAGSVCCSADMAHAVHPNYPERHEPHHRPLPNQGPALKLNANARYATDALGAAVFIEACEAARVPWQQFVSRSNLACGSTIGPITATKLGITTFDVGCPQLSMHSARELMGAHDPGYLQAALIEFLQARAARP